LTDAAGIPLAVAVDGANRPDMKMVEETLSAVQAEPAHPKQKRNLCLDKGYDYPVVERIVKEFGLIPHIRSRGEEKKELENLPNYRARRWVVERAHSWMNRFRRILVRWEKKKENYLGMIYLTCAFIALNAAGVFG
jgi:hypothetical protein